MSFVRGPLSPTAISVTLTHVRHHSEVAWARWKVVLGVELELNLAQRERGAYFPLVLLGSFSCVGVVFSLVDQSKLPRRLSVWGFVAARPQCLVLAWLKEVAQQPLPRQELRQPVLLVV